MFAATFSSDRTEAASPELALGLCWVLMGSRRLGSMTGDGTKSAEEENKVVTVMVKMQATLGQCVLYRNSVTWKMIAIRRLLAN